MKLSIKSFSILVSRSDKRDVLCCLSALLTTTSTNKHAQGYLCHTQVHCFYPSFSFEWSSQRYTVYYDDCTSYIVGQLHHI